MKTFHKISAYVMEENLLQPYLSAKELMIIAAKLKMGDHISTEKKEATVCILHCTVGTYLLPKYVVLQSCFITTKSRSQDRPH